MVSAVTLKTLLVKRSRSSVRMIHASAARFLSTMKSRRMMATPIELVMRFCGRPPYGLPMWNGSVVLPPVVWPSLQESLDDDMMPSRLEGSSFLRKR